MRVARSVLGLALAGLVTGALSVGATTAAPVSAAVETSLNDVRVGSFNISAVTFDPQASGDHEVWRLRRPVVASQILASGLDVVGVQEANPSSVYKDRLVSGANQFMDLKNALNEKGGHYALTNEFSYNCAVSTRSGSCTYQNRGAALDNRIYYDTDTVALVKQGSYRFSAQTAGKYERYLAWAVFRMKATGKQFFFTNTHLDPYNTTTRVTQWKQAIAKTLALKGTLPVISVGDYNSTKYSTWSSGMLSYTKNKGLGDVLNQEYRVNPVRVRRAESTKRAYINSFNAFRRDANVYCYCSRRDKYGNNIDWVFASNQLRVRSWEVVVNVNPDTMRLQGVIPSDHNLVTATVVL